MFPALESLVFKSAVADLKSVSFSVFNVYVVFAGTLSKACSRMVVSPLPTTSAESDFAPIEFPAASFATTLLSILSASGELFVTRR